MERRPWIGEFGGGGLGDSLMALFCEMVAVYARPNR